MRNILIVVLMFCAVAAGPTSTPATGPADASVQRMIRSLQQQIAELKEENAKLRAENARLKKSQPVPAAAAQNDLKIGMTLDDADAVCTKRKWDYGSSRRETADHVFDTWDFSHLTSNDAPIRVHFVDGKISSIDRF